jgi:hypothetical protein
MAEIGKPDGVHTMVSVKPASAIGTGSQGCSSLKDLKIVRSIVVLALS